MTLSEDDQNSLERIEDCLMADDPLFATRLDVDAARRSLRRRSRLAGYGFWVGLVIMLVGSASAQGALSIGTMVSLYGFTLLAWSTLTLLRCRQAIPPCSNPDHFWRG